jgi:hypothetical protein
MEIITRFSERSSWRYIDLDLLAFYYEALRPVQGYVPILRDITLRLQDSDVQCRAEALFSQTCRLWSLSFPALT